MPDLTVQQLLWYAYFISSAGVARPKCAYSSDCIATLPGSFLCTRSPTHFPMHLQYPDHGTVANALGLAKHVWIIFYLAAQTQPHHILNPKHSCPRVSVARRETLMLSMRWWIKVSLSGQILAHETTNKRLLWEKAARRSCCPAKTDSALLYFPRLLVIVAAVSTDMATAVKSPLSSFSLKPKRQQDRTARELRSLVRELRAVISENRRPHTDNNAAGSGFRRRRSAPERAHRTTLYVLPLFPHTARITLQSEASLGHIWKIMWFCYVSRKFSE